MGSGIDMSRNPSRGYLYVVCRRWVYYNETWPAEAGFGLPYFGDPALLRRISRALKLWLPNPFPGDTLLIEITRR